MTTDTPLRVLQVTARYLPLVGGTEMHTYQVASRLATSGIDVTVLTTDRGGQLLPVEEIAGVSVRRVRAWPSGRDYYFAPDLIPVITEERWDVVHCQGYHTLVAPLAMLAALRARIPYVLTFHSGGHSSRLRQALRGAQIGLLRPLLVRASRLIAVSEFERRHFSALLRLPAGRIVVIPNGSDLPRLPRQPAAVPARLIVSVGRLERYKGHQRVIAALPGVLAHQPEARLQIVGSGPYEPELRRLAAKLGVAERVEIGAISGADREAMARLLASAGVVALLSDYESQGLGATEALSLGCPLLVNDASALSDLTRYPLVRAVPPDAGPEAVARALLELLALEREANAGGIVLPTWEACTADLLALYQSIVRPGGGDVPRRTPLLQEAPDVAR
ncbi:MAG: glycosyltransferase family 4 protein [Anaerolineae bacterium]|nr:glycosyltransferase family 4 protein [Anaerolineae bacterium]